MSDEYQHLGVVWGRGRLTLYVNGSEVVSTRFSRRQRLAVLLRRRSWTLMVTARVSSHGASAVDEVAVFDREVSTRYWRLAE